MFAQSKSSDLVSRRKLSVHHRTECGFELDTFFEPHVREWLKSVEEVDTHEWVSRAVGMDSVRIPRWRVTLANPRIAVGSGRQPEA